MIVDSGYGVNCCATRNGGGRDDLPGKSYPVVQRFHVDRSGLYSNEMFEIVDGVSVTQTLRSAIANVQAQAAPQRRHVKEVLYL